MLPHKQLHFVYLIICIILLISTIFHCYIHHKTTLPDKKITDEKDYKFYINKAQDGMIRGILFGMVLDGGVSTAIRNGAIYGIFNPLIALLSAI